MSIRNYRDLRVWQMGMGLVEQIYKITAQFPKHEMYGLASQLQRCAVSIPSNIAEGHTRSHKKEYLQALSVAQGSLSELETQLEISTRLSYITEEVLEQLLQTTSSLGKQLYSLSNAIEKKVNQPHRNPKPET
jgi:four helix bundle protein